MNSSIQDRNSNFSWEVQGPSPLQNSPTVSLNSNDEGTGAINTALAHPNNPDILYIGAVNGGVWRTTNATASSPNWQPLTDELRGNSITALDFDPTDSTHQTLIAGVGRTSSFANRGGSLTGLLLTTDGGNSFTQITGNPDRAQEDSLIGRNISGVAKRGDLILASADNRGRGIRAGVYRSTDNGTTWEFISNSNRLPFGAAFDLVGDPTNPDRFYVSVQGEGIFLTNDGGKNWDNISDNNTTIDAAITGGSNSLTEMSVASNGRLYAAVLRDNPSINDIFQYVGFSDNQGVDWTAIDIPPIIGRGFVNHFSIQADPNDSNILYIAGVQGPFRGDTTANSGNQWVSLAGFGNTANGTSPHVDSRDLVFDANGELIQVDDGGIYRRTKPQDTPNQGDWFSINSNLQVTELHDITYDTISNIIIGGTQDNGTVEQIETDSVIWNAFSGADGGDVAVSVNPNNASQSVRYSSFQNLGSFRRRVFDANNNLISQTFPSLTGFNNNDRQFVTPVVVNEVDPSRIAIGGRTRVYESFNQGNNVTIINTAGGGSVSVNSSEGDPIVYGGARNGVDNPDVLYVGSRFRVFRRTTPGGTLENTNYPGGQVRDIALDRDDWMSAFVIDNDQVFRTIDVSTDNTDNDGDGDIDETDEIEWHQITGNLVEDFRDGFDLNLRSIEFIDIPHLDDAIAVGTNRGVFASLSLTDFTHWFPVGIELPNAPVWDMDYDPTDDILVAGTLGRGAWSFPDTSESITTIVSSSNPTPDDDILIGTPDPDEIDALAGDDFVNGLESNDTLTGGDDNDTLKGNEGNDSLNGGEDEDEILGEEGNDTLEGGDNRDTLDGGEGNDILKGEDGDDLMKGGAGDDELDGGEDRDEMFGEDGDDTLEGGDNRDTLDGGEGNDILKGEDGDDLMKGGAGDDELDGGEDRDEMFGDEDNDTLNGGNSNDLLDGGDGNDILNGEDDDDLMKGGAGNDVLNGGADRDELSGGAGDDILDGGEGEDELLGGEGADIFRLSLDEDTDIILDYQDGLDQFELVGLTFDDLSFLQDGSQALITIPETEDILATLIGVDASVIDAGDFV